MQPTRRDVTDRLFGVIAWLAVTLIGVKAYYLGCLLYTSPSPRD